MITNYLSPIEFRVAVKRLPNVEFFVQRTAIPSISAGPVEVPNPFNKTFFTQDKLSFSNLELTFIVDEQMNNYLEIYQWINDISFPRSFDEFKRVNESQDSLQSDISIQILTSHKNASLEFQFVNCFPIALSDVLLDTTQTSIIPVEVTATFQYDSFSIKRLTNS